jgi:hypothetical protein
LSAFRTGITWAPLLLAYLLGVIVTSGGYTNHRDKKSGPVGT